MAIPVILKGDTSAKIPLALADGFKYEGCTLVVECCGIIRRLSTLEAGGSIAVNYSADETARMPLGTSNVFLSLLNANDEKQSLPFAKLKVTDSPAEVYDAPIVVDPGLMSIEDLPTRFNDEDVRNRVNAIIAWMKRGVAVLAFAVLPVFGAGLVVQTAPKGQVYNDQPVVTNVVLDASAFASKDDLQKVEKQIADAKDTLATNLIKTVINNGTYNLTYDPVLKVTWRKEAENGVFYEKCYTNINMIGVPK